MTRRTLFASLAALFVGRKLAPAAEDIAAKAGLTAFPIAPAAVGIPVLDVTINSVRYLWVTTTGSMEINTGNPLTVTITSTTSDPMVITSTRYESLSLLRGWTPETPDVIRRLRSPEEGRSYYKAAGLLDLSDQKPLDPRDVHVRG